MTTGETRSQFEGKAVGPGAAQLGKASASASFVPPAASPLELRLAELEYENLRLQRLVAELLIKNQELRKALCQ